MSLEIRPLHDCGDRIDPRLPPIKADATNKAVNAFREALASLGIPLPENQASPFSGPAIELALGMLDRKI
ncbi:MAG: hypothetical protein V1936_01690 [Patescibacteria group bacterium]